MKQAIQFLLIDPQNDFCDLPSDWLPLHPATGGQLRPALPVAGAHADMLRLAQLIREGADGIGGITVTLDSHHRLDIAHPTFWQTRGGAAVTPFTAITAAQVRAGDFQPRDGGALPRALAYLDELERRGRYTLMVWPVHCEIGSWGHNVHAAVKDAYNAWEEGQLRTARVIGKGHNPWTEHYSAIQAEVPDAEDPHTELNLQLLRSLDDADLIVLAGEASSHCVRATTEHLVAHLPSGDASRLVLVTDCMSPVQGFEAQHQAFLAEMTACGVQLRTSDELLALLRANGASTSSSD